jgi:hypothetical protein
MTQAEAAGAMNRWVQICTFQRTEAGWAWVPDRGTWARLEVGTGRNLFSSVGVGARDCTLHLRTQRLSLDDAICAGAQHIFLTALTPGSDRGHMTVRGALVELVRCVADAHLGPGGVEFPGVLTEKYLGHEQREPYAVNALTYVLVTPKVIALRRGGLVTVEGVNYEVLTAHILDPHKSEYEIRRLEDL